MWLDFSSWPLGCVSNSARRWFGFQWRPCNNAEVVKKCGWQILNTDPQTQYLSFSCIPVFSFPSCSSFPVMSTDYFPFISQLSCPLPSSIFVLFFLYVVLSFLLIGVCWLANPFVLYHHIYLSIISRRSISFLFLFLLSLFMISWHLLFSSQISFFSPFLVMLS